MISRYGLRSSTLALTYKVQEGGNKVPIFANLIRHSDVTFASVIKMTLFAFKKRLREYI